MSVGGCGQAIMVVLRRFKCARAEVECLHHAACGHDTQHAVEERIVVPCHIVQTLSQGFVAADVQLNAL